MTVRFTISAVCTLLAALTAAADSQPARRPAEPRPAPLAARVHDVEAGPLFDQAEADKTCPTVCKAPTRWNGGWRTTKPGVMSVCACELLGAPTSVAVAAPCPPADLFTHAAHVTNGTLAFCDGDRRDCWVLDAVKGTWSQQQQIAGPTIVVAPSKVTACASDGKDCISVVTAAYPEMARAAVSSDRSKIAVWVGGTLDIYDTASAKRLTTIRGWRSPMGPAKEAQFGDAIFVGDKIAVWQAWTPVSSVARLFDARTGKRIADVRKAGTEIEAGAVQVAPKTWAFAGWDPKLYVVNVATGKVRKTIALAGARGGRLMPGKLTDGRIVIIEEGVALVDLVSGRSVPLAPPVCTK